MFATHFLPGPNNTWFPKLGNLQNKETTIAPWTIPTNTVLTHTGLIPDLNQGKMGVDSPMNQNKPTEQGQCSASPAQTVAGKDISNPLMAGALPKSMNIDKPLMSWADQVEKNLPTPSMDNFYKYGQFAGFQFPSTDFMNIQKPETSTASSKHSKRKDKRKLQLNDTPTSSTVPPSSSETSTNIEDKMKTMLEAMFQTYLSPRLSALETKVAETTVDKNIVPQPLIDTTPVPIPSDGDNRSSSSSNTRRDAYHTYLAGEGQGDSDGLDSIGRHNIDT